MCYTMVIFSQLYDIEQQRMTFGNMSYEAQQKSSPVISQELKSTPDASVQMSQTRKAPLDYPQCFLEVENGSAWIHYLREGASSVQSFACARAESVKLRELFLSQECLEETGEHCRRGCTEILRSCKENF